MLTKADFFRMAEYYPHEKQAEIHNSPARYRVVAAGARSGKSMLAGAEIAYRILFPNQRIWAVSSQYELAEKEFVWALNFLEKIKIRGTRIINHARITNAQRGMRTIEFPWGSFVKTKSTEKPQALLGEELDLVVLCEASQIQRSVWERMLRARIGPRNGFVLATSTPFFDDNLFSDFYKNTKDETLKNDWAGWNFSVLCNPSFPKNEYYRAKEELDPKVFAEQYDGQFVERCGKMFTLNSLNFIGEDVIPSLSDLPIICGLHYKSNNPTAVVFLAIDSKSGSCYLYDEIYEREKTPKQIFPEIWKRTSGKNFRGVIVNYWDHAIQKELKDAGFMVASNTKEKEIGQTVAYLRRLQGLSSYLKIKSDGKARLYITKNCINTINDFENARWPEKRESEEQKHEIEMPLTKHLFAPLATSYPLTFLENLGVDIYGSQSSLESEQERVLSVW